MAGLQRIEVTRVERGTYRFYRVLSSEDRQHSTLNSHLFTPGELLALAAYVEQNYAQLVQEAKEDEEEAEEAQE
jgi:hypothetical protein